MKSFLQSKEWADFQESLGHRTWRIDDILIIEHNLSLNKNYLYSPHCGENFLSESFLEKVKKIANQENSIFFRAEPVKADKELLKKFNFKKGHNIQFQKTLVLDITKSEQELLKQIHYKTRYNIRLAEKKGIKVKEQRTMNSEQSFERFWEMLQDTAKRGEFHTHPKEHYKKMLEIPGVELFVALYRDKIIAANIVLFYNKTITYLHGASDYKYRNLMAPHLLQWEQIKEAKRRGCVEYDFWGIDEKKWPGVTRFKKGFGGKEVIHPGAFDLIFQPIWYGIYKIAKKVL